MVARCLFAVLPLVCDALRLGRKGPGAKANGTAVGAGDAGALLEQSYLNQLFDGYLSNMYYGNGVVRSGPRSVTMGRGGTGQQWDVSVGSNYFKITIENGVTEEYGRDINFWLRELARPPPEIRRAYEIASQHQGVAIYHSLGGSCGHGNYNYINLDKWADIGCACHEAGHTIDNHVRMNYEPNLANQFEVAGQWDGIGVSSYGDNNVGEAFAEFARIYAYAIAGGALSTLRSQSPQRFGLFEHAVYRAGGGNPKLPMCWCRTPNQGTSGWNGFSCNDGSTGWCQGHQSCYNEGWWNQDQPYPPPDACR